MKLGSFELDGVAIDVKTSYDNISGRVYQFVRADNQQQVAVTTYRGIDVDDGVGFSAADLQRGLASVRKTARR